MSGLCLLAAGTVVARLAIAGFTLGWTHSVEKIPWEEDWTVGETHLRIVAARVRGTGAGMEPPAQARLSDGWWRWETAVPPIPELVLRRSGATADWLLCWDGRCHQMDTLVPGDADPVALRPCERISP